jgi:hypothetical protein
MVSDMNNNNTTKEDALLDAMLKQLTDEELEIAARSSFRYLMRRVSTAAVEGSNGGDVAAPSICSTHQQELETEQRFHARAMARRYLLAKDGDMAVALARMKATLTFRQEYDVDALRLCFSQDSAIASSVDPNAMGTFRKALIETMAQNALVVQGCDMQGRAFFVGVPRHHCSFFDPTNYVMDRLYTLERAIACAEANGQEQVIAVMDYAGYNPMRHDPPMDVIKQVLQNLRSHYVGRLHRIYIVNAPLSMRALWRIIKPFAGRETRSKLIFVADDPAEKKRLLSPTVDRTQAPAWMMPEGQLPHGGPIDLVRYLKETPFDQPYTPQ